MPYAGDPVIALLFALAFASQVDVDCAPVLGKWTGTGHQPGFGTWDIDWRLDRCGASDHPIGTVRYPTLDCGGTLHWVGMENDVFVVEERVFGGTCAPRGLVRLRVAEDGQLDWSWYWSDGSLGATSVLTRATGD